MARKKLSKKQKATIKRMKKTRQIKNSGNVSYFKLSDTILANSLQVYLNGLLQEEGSGKDYTIRGTTIIFTPALVSKDIIKIH